MLRISKLADYGTVIMVYLAKHPQQLCNARDIALHTHLTVPTVSKLLKRLTAAGLVRSVGGVAGGYRFGIGDAVRLVHGSCRGNVLPPQEGEQRRFAATVLRQPTGVSR